MISKQNVLDLVTTFALGQDDQTETAIFYDEIIRELGFKTVLTGAETLAITAGTNAYTVSPDNILSLEYYSGNRGYLTMTNDQNAKVAFGAGWRSSVGTPVALSRDNQSDNNFTLIPSPSSDDTLTVIRSEVREDIPDWLVLPITFDILAREFSRESDHQDIEFSSACKQFSILFFQMVGVS